MKKQYRILVFFDGSSDFAEPLTFPDFPDFTSFSDPDFPEVFPEVGALAAKLLTVVPFLLFDKMGFPDY